MEDHHDLNHNFKPDKLANKTTLGAYMWHNTYKDYSHDAELKKAKVHPGKGIIGCEMHEINGWSESYHQARETHTTGILSAIWASLTGSKINRDKDS